MTKVFCTGCGVVTPVGDTPEAVFLAVRAGRSALQLYPAQPEPYMASLLSREGFNGPSFFEHIAIEAARKAVAQAGLDPSGPRVGMVLSTIKGNVEQIDSEDVSLAAAATRIAAKLGVTSKPVVVSNACISGLAALIQGMRMLRSGAYDHVIVVGAEVQSRFIVTGFQSLKALSLQACKPFDADRDGLNLGEAAAAMVLRAEMPGQAGHDGVMADTDRPSLWELVDGAVRNDANHISGPSRTGEGSYNALKYLLPLVNREQLAFVNVHGTATRYNDEMEAIALERAGLLDVPVNALKGIFGHTMGAAGILESIVSMQACDAGMVLPTQGFSELGVSRPVWVSAQEMSTHGTEFIKLLSGFGGVNGALLFRKGGAR